jgi:PAS domain S-box-containing protein
MLVLFDGDSGAIDTLRFVEERLGIGLSVLDIDPRTGDWSRGLYSRPMKWSAGAYRLLGLEPGSVEASFSLLDSLTHPEDRRAPSELEASLRTGEPREREFRVIQATGIMRWLQVRSELLRDEQGVPIRKIAVWTDVSARNEARDALSEYQQRFQGLVRVSNHPVWITRADGGVIDIFGWQEVTGQSLGEALGLGWLETIHPDDRDVTLNAWTDAIARSALFEVEHRIRTKEGGYRWFRSRSSAPCKAHGTVFARVGVSLDIHDEKMWPKRSDEALLTGAQIRAARGILNWSVRDLAEATAISPSTIRRLEETDGVSHVPKESALEIKNSLRSAGIEFLFPPSGKPGVSPN